MAVGWSVVFGSEASGLVGFLTRIFYFSSNHPYALGKLNDWRLLGSTLGNFELNYDPKLTGVEELNLAWGCNLYPR